ATARPRVSGNALHRHLARNHHPRRQLSRPPERSPVAGGHLVRAAQHERHAVPEEPLVMRRSACLVAALLLLAGCSGLAKVEPSKFPDPKRDSITFWGHACSYIDVGGMGIVTDPVFAKTLFARHRFIGSPPDEALRGTRIVLLSHAHDDHTDPPSL